MRSALTWWFVAILWALTTWPADGQQRPQPDRPRIGLVLGGGGARGGAHVGVLRVLEELRVPVDAIAGTSMGAIVGGLYAAGLRADEIERELLATDWERVFATRPPRQQTDFRRKQDDAHLLVDFELGFRDGRFRLPGGVVGAHEPNLLLERLALPVAHIRDFDRLPIPFRAVATDLGTGEAVILREGRLARAIRASMSIPGAFAPVVLDGHLLVDGGVVRNMPIDAMRELDVDVILAVDVGTPLADAEALESALGIYAQTLTIFTRSNSLEQLRSLSDRDVVLRPQLGQLGTLEFGRIAEAVEAGAVATRAHSARLEALALAPGAWQEHLRERTPARAPLVLDFIRIDAPARVPIAAIEGRIRLADGDTVDATRLVEQIDRIYALGVFERVDFEVIDEDGRTGLVVQPTEKSWGPGLLRFGLRFLDAPDGNSGFDLIANYTQTGIGRLGADLRTEIQVGSTRRSFAELHQPLQSAGGFFVAPSIEGRQELASAVERSVRIASYDTERLRLGLDAGRDLGSWGQFRAGVRREWITSEPEIGQPDLESFRAAQWAAHARLAFDDLDDPGFPTAGSAGSIGGFRANRGSAGASHHARLDAQLLVALSTGPHTLIVGLEGGSSLGTQLPIYEVLGLGGLFRLSGLRRQEITGSEMALARLLYFNRTGSGGALGLAGGLRLGGSLEIGNTWARRAARIDDLRVAASVFAALDTVLGPLYFAYGSADRGRQGWYISLGHALH